MALEFFRKTPDTLTITFKAGDFDTTGATLKVVFKSATDASSIDEEDDKAVLKKSVSIPTNVTSVDIALSSSDLTLTPGTYVCGAKLFLSGGTIVPIELRDNTVEISLSTLQDVTL